MAQVILYLLKIPTFTESAGRNEISRVLKMTNEERFSLNNHKVFDLRLCRAKDSISTELDGETVILDIASGIYSGLDTMGTFIWNQLSCSVSVATLRDAILTRYDVTEEQCVADLLNFLRALADNGSIEVDNEATG